MLSVVKMLEVRGSIEITGILEPTLGGGGESGKVLSPLSLFASTNAGGPLEKQNEQYPF